MCGRTVMALNAEELQNITGAVQFNNEDSYRPSYNNPPMRVLPVLLDIEHTRQLDLYRWGIMKQYSTFNARADKLDTSKLYKGMVQKRCLVPIQGFYEWKNKEPFYFKSNDKSEVMYLAGMYRKMKEEGQELHSFTIITKNANDQIKPFHHRMPVIIKEKDMDIWLNAKWEDAKELLNDSKVELIIYPADKRVGNFRNDDKELIIERTPVKQQKTIESFFKTQAKNK